jgi:S1-C subfamily serine protease
MANRNHHQALPRWGPDAICFAVLCEPSASFAVKNRLNRKVRKVRRKDTQRKCGFKSKLHQYLFLCLIAGGLATLVALVAAVTSASPSVHAHESSPANLDQLKRSVVIITTYDAQGKPLLQGSGFFIDAEQVVTSLHVIKGASQIRLETFAGTTETVTSVLATNEASDLALLRLAQRCPDTAILHLVSTPPQEGEAVILVSSPQGSRWKVTRGNVGMLFEFAGISSRLQITAAIAPGSSGGPVVNEQGEVVGVAALYINRAEELNFAVPAANLMSLRAQVRVNYAPSKQHRPASARKRRARPVIENLVAESAHRKATIMISRPDSSSTLP